MFDICNPRQVIFVTSRARINLFGKNTTKDNVTAINKHMPVSKKPMFYAISLHKDRFTLDLIRSSGVFCTNFCGKELKEAMLFCKEHNGKHMDKFNRAKLSKKEANTIDCPLIDQHKGVFECSVINEIETGDHVILIAKIMHMQKEFDAPRLFNSSIF